MDRRKQLRHFIRRARRNLNQEYALPILQYGILLSFFSSTAILLVSRLFVFPHYSMAAICMAIGTVLATAIYIWWKRIRDKEAMHRLDSFYPHNELVTALSLADEANPMVESIMQKAVHASPDAFNRFKNRKKVVWKPKALIGIMLLAMMMGALFIFPSATQQQALMVEKERSVVKEVEKEVAQLEKKSEAKEIKKQLQELEKKLKELDNSEEALREVVKKQKELKLQEQKLKEKQELAKQDSGDGAEGLMAEEQKQLKELTELQKELANTAKNTQTALNQLGKPLSFDLQNAIASELGSESASTDASAGEQSDAQGKGGEGKESGNGKDGENNSSGQGEGKGGQGNGNSSGNGSGQGSGQGGSGGKGGAGQGSGQGSGIGQGSGTGQGERDLLSIPDRIGRGGETTADGGPIGNGTAAGEQKGSVPVTKGTVRPYEDAIGDYKESYLKSTERMQLPKDLQDIVQSYFSSIESE